MFICSIVFDKDIKTNTKLLRIISDDRLSIMWTDTVPVQ